MAFPNPTINPPVLRAPSRQSVHSRSPSYSPAPRLRETDPLLRALSPTTTLQAFTTELRDLASLENNVLGKSVELASSTERAIGARAAQACLDIRSWTRELEHWEWPGSFEEPRQDTKKLRMSTLSYTSLVSGNGSSPDEDEKFWGSLPSHTVRHYEQRIREISQQLEKVDLEDLKQYALAAHDGTTLGTMNDSTALVTATVLQALPYLSRLATLLDVWKVRLQILRQVPAFCADLKRARRDMDHGWAALAVSPTSPVSPTFASFSRDTAEDMRGVVAKQVTSLGQRLDGFLDDLEGTQETVPETWIENFEQLEQAYGDWVMQADQKVLENEWRRSMHSKHNPVGSPELETNVQEQDFAFDGSGLVEDNAHGEYEERSGRSLHATNIPRPKTSKDSLSKSPYRQRYKAIVLTYDGDGQHYPIQGLTGDVPHVNEPESTFAPEAAFNVTPRLPPLSLKPSASTLSSKGSFEARLSGSEFPNGHAVNPTPPLPPPSARVSASTLSSKASKENSLGRTSGSSVHTTLSSSTSAPTLSVKKRAAFLDKGQEGNSSLNLTSQTPVRPFEHASNAFTRLFKNLSPEHKLHKSQRVEESPKSSTKHRRLSLTRSLSRKGSRKSLRSVQNEDAPPVPTEALTHDVSKARPVTPEQPRDRAEAHRQLSSPFHSPRQGESEDWPLASPKKVVPGPELPTYTLRKARSTSDVRPSKDFGNAFAWMFKDGALKTIEDDTSDQRSERNLLVDSLPLEPSTGLEEERAAGLALPGSMSPQTDSSSLSHITADQSQLGPAVVVHATTTQERDEKVLMDELNESNFYKARLSTIVSGEDITSRAFKMFADQQPSQSRRASSPMLPKLKTTKLDQASERPTVIRRASMASIESHPRSELKSVTISRKNSASSLSSHPATPRSARTKPPLHDLAHGDQTPDSPMSYKNGIKFPRPPSQSSALNTPASERPVSHLRKDSLPFSSPAIVESEEQAYFAGGHEGNARSTNTEPPELRDGQFHSSSDDSTEAGEELDRSDDTVPSSPISPAKSPRKPALATRDNFDRHVTEILERVDAPIEFKMRPGAKVPNPRASIGSKPRLRHESFGKSGSGLTIAPAEPSPRKPTSSTQPEVKLYHLTQAGREEPIKLFVRLVGEGERVMVRVGGGWADLADYLKQYAEHHGSRTVSNSGIEINAVDANGHRRVSGNAVAKAAAAFAAAEKQAQAGAEGQNTVDNEGASEPNSPLVGSSPFATYAAAPSQRSSRPPTSDGARPLSRQGTADGSLAGPSGGKKTELSESKARWVEGMIEKAKSQSAEKSKAEKKFGDLGKIGATRRVIFRSAHGANGNGNAEK